MEELVRVENLSFAYDEKKVLENIDFKVNKGEKIAVMGANGAGKSTFFLNLNGVLKPCQGTIYLEGKEVKNKGFKELHRRVGFVFQNPDSQIIGSTVKSEISFGPLNLGFSKKKVMQKVDEAINYMDLKGYEERAPWYLSGGEKKRVSIADILAMDTELLIFDEPMAALDPINADNVEKILNRLHEDGKTLLIATHDVDFAYRFADRICVFLDGEVIADGLPKEVFHDIEIMRRAHLRKPIVMEIWDKIKEKQVLRQEEINPLTIEELLKFL